MSKISNLVNAGTPWLVVYILDRLVKQILAVTDLRNIEFDTVKLFKETVDVFPSDPLWHLKSGRSD